MQQPEFWHQDKSLRAALLRPLSWLWQRVSARRMAKGPWHHLDVPVVCVGNINVGGTGKTPVVIALLSALQDRGVAAHVVSRGYGGSLKGPVRVDERSHSSAEVGDEPLLISAFGPAWISADRHAGALAAIAAGAEVVLLDDGLQNPTLHKDLSIVVVDAATGFGNGRVMPAGPLREPVDSGLARADLVVSVGDARAQADLLKRWPALQNTRCLGAHLAPLQTGMDWHGLRVLAFAGIGKPAKFFDSLAAQGATLVKTMAFADHEEYAPTLLNRLLNEAQKANLQLVTTEKDAVRLPHSFRPQVLTLPVRLTFDDPAALNDILDRLS